MLPPEEEAIPTYSLADSETIVATLETDLETANAQAEKLQSDVSSQRNINSTLSSELKTVKSSKHFESLQELTDWLHEDDTDTKYTDESNAQKAFIQQVRALRDGYLLSGFTLTAGEAAVFAVIEDEYWVINPEDDDTEKVYNIDPLPSHPLP